MKRSGGEMIPLLAVGYPRTTCKRCNVSGIRRQRGGDGTKHCSQKTVSLYRLPAMFWIIPLVTLRPSVAHNVSLKPLLPISRET